MLTKHVEHVLTQKTRCVKRKRPVNSFWRGKDPGKDENTLGQSYLDIIRPWSTLSGHEQFASQLINSQVELEIASDQTFPDKCGL